VPGQMIDVLLHPAQGGKVVLGEVGDLHRWPTVYVRAGVCGSS
jgi:hypothetical protein